MVTTLNPYEIMWLFVMFDLPTDTKQAKRYYSEFRKKLLERGFTMFQYSVYARCFPTEAHLSTHVRGISTIVPPDGEVRLLSITDKQFGKSQIFRGKVRQVPEKSPRQLSFF
jgi:CRISPR-associated protein Cas2